MSNEWVVLELSPKAEGEDPDLICASIRHQIKDAEIYLPVSVTRVGGDRVINYLVDGYAFLKREHPDDKYYKLEGSRYVQTVLTRMDRSNGRPTRQIACATDEDIDRFKSQIHEEDDQGIDVGDTIMVTSGPYRQIKAVVIEDIPENDAVQVHVKLRSKESLVTLPRSFLRLVEKAPRAALLPRCAALRELVNRLKALSFDQSSLATIQGRLPVYSQLYGREARLATAREGFSSGLYLCGLKDFDVKPVEKKLGRYDRLQSLAYKYEDGRKVYQNGQYLCSLKDFDLTPVVETSLQLQRLQTLTDRWEHGKGALQEAQHFVSMKDFDARPLEARSRRFERLHGWYMGVQEAAPVLSGLAGVARFPDVEKAYVKCLYIDEVYERLEPLVLFFEKHPLDDKAMTDNIIIDGHNLAIRCATVPGLDTLKDSQGRPTGAILGFLRCLGSFAKKFPGARVTVVWDGSSQRRRKVFTEYKANRKPVHSFFEIEYLKGLLPSLGIRQVWNPEEEADDVVATLVRGEYRGQHNVVIGTDRDMLQLVTETDSVFVPAVGAGKEHLYDVGTVEKEYGIRPDRIVHFRALDGDTSDNIPGVPGFGPKIASKLLQLYGTIEGIFASNLAGITPAQYKKLRAAEKQVKLNVGLMTLCTDIPLTFVESNPDQTVASKRLQNVDMKVDTILPVFFPTGAGA